MRLHLGPGPLPALLAPGVPDWIGADGTRIGWVLRDVLVWLDGAHATVVRLPDLGDEVAPGPAGWTVATALGAAVVNADGTLGRCLSVDDGEPLAVLPGTDCVLVQAVPEHTLVRLDRGVAVPIPDAATRARFIGPFTIGVGAVWIDLDLLFRLREGAVPQALGRVSGAQAMAVGPDGAVLVATTDDTVCAAPRGLPARLGHSVDVESARFSPDGTRALVADESGVAELDLGTGKELRRWDGALVPVGYAPGPIRWNRDTGALVDEADAVRATGFAGAAPSSAGDLLVGPGGAVWSLGGGRALRTGLRPGVTATDGHRVVDVDAECIHLDDASYPHHLLDGDDEIEAVRLDADGIRVGTASGRVARFTLAGAQTQVHEGGALEVPEPALPDGVTLSDPAEPSNVDVRGQLWPVPADGAARVGDAVWAWSYEGMLVALPLS